jgi:hypothetical protein
MKILKKYENGGTMMPENQDKIKTQDMTQLTFDEAFKKAKAAGLKTFTWNGKKYSTEIKDRRTIKEGEKKTPSKSKDDKDDKDVTRPDGPRPIKEGSSGSSSKQQGGMGRMEKGATLMEKGSKMFKEGGLGGDLKEVKVKDKDESTKLKKVETKKLPTGESPRLNPQPKKMEMEKMAEKDDSVTINPTERSRRRPGMSETKMKRLDKREMEKARKGRKKEEEMMMTMSDREKKRHSRRRAREERRMERKQIRYGGKEGRRYRRTMRRKAREERRKARGMEYTAGRRISPRRWYKNLVSKLTGGRAGGADGGLKGYKDFRTATTDPGYYEDTSGQALRSRRDRTGGKVKSGRGVFTQTEGSVKRHKGTGRDLDRYYDELGGAKKGAMVNKYVNGGKPKKEERENRLQVAREKKENLPTFRKSDVTIPQHKGGKKLYNLAPSDAKKGAMVNKYVNGGVSNRKFNRFSDKEVQEFLKQNKAAEDMKKHREFTKTRDEAVRKIKQPKTGTKTLTKKEMRRILMKKGGKQLLKRMVPMITAAEIAYLIATADKEAPQKQLKKRAKNQSYNIGRKI